MGGLIPAGQDQGPERRDLHDPASWQNARYRDLATVLSTASQIARSAGFRPSS